MRSRVGIHLPPKAVLVSPSLSRAREIDVGIRKRKRGQRQAIAGRRRLRPSLIKCTSSREQGFLLVFLSGVERGGAGGHNCFLHNAAPGSTAVSERREEGQLHFSSFPVKSERENAVENKNASPGECCQELKNADPLLLVLPCGGGGNVANND